MTQIIIFGSILLAVAGIAWVLGTAFSESAEEAAGAYEDELSQTLESMFLFLPAKRLVELSWLLAGVVFFIFFVPFCFQFERPWIIPLGLIIAGGFGTLAFFLPRLFVKHLKKRRLHTFNLQLLEALPMMSNALRAGFSINQAFETVANELGAPMRQEVRLFLQQLRVGVSFSDALQAFDKRVGSEDLTLVCTAIDIARRSGGNLTEIFDTITTTIRARQRIHQRIRALTAQGRLQGLIIGAMPFLLTFGMCIFKPALMLPFIFSLTGMITLLVVTVFVALGGLIIRKIITIDV